MTKHSHKPGENIAEETVTLFIVEERLSEDIRELIESSKSRFTLAANAVLVILYWNVVKRINAEILGNERAEYGKEIVSALSRQLTSEYGKGFIKCLFYVIRSAEVYPEKIVHAPSEQLSWTHFREMIHIKDDELRFLIWAPAFIGFYAWLIDSNVITGILRRVAVS